MRLPPWAFRLAFLLPIASPPPARADEPPKPAPIVADLTLKGTIGEEPPPIGLEGTPIGDNLKGIVDRIARARKDDKVKAMVVRLRDLSIGWGKADELRGAIEDFRKSGKRAVALLEQAGNAEYYIATAADEVVIPETGTLMLKGLAAEVTFYKKLFDKLGVRADALQIGEFKAAAEPFSRAEMSPAFREEISSLLADDYRALVEAIARRQGIAPDEAKALIDDGPYTAASAKATGLVDRVAYPDQLEAEIAKHLGIEAIKLDPKYGKPKGDSADLSGLAGFLKLLQSLSGEGAKKAASKKPKVALIYATGMIREGKSSSGSLLGDAVMGSDTVIKHLKEAEKDETVKAIVLRVDSPGGSAVASDLIWREATRIEKPIVASMSDVAASGGYYISVGCDKVFAEPGTVTGSIGVVGVKLAFGDLMEKFGVTTDTVTIGKHGRIESSLTPYTDEERAAVRRIMEDVYRRFVAKVASGRKMEEAQVEKLAGGRVYTGRKAKELGLVDELGSLEQAIAAAKELAKLGPDEETELLVLPKPPGLFEGLLAPLEDRDILAPAVSMPLPEPIRSSLARFKGLMGLVGREPVILALPFDLRIR